MMVIHKLPNYWHEQSSENGNNKHNQQKYPMNVRCLFAHLQSHFAMCDLQKL